MLVKIISLTFDSVRGGFDDSSLREFLKDKEVVSISDHFFVRNEVPFLTLIIKYFPYRQETDANFSPQGKRDESWREELSESDMGVFNLLREWRAKRSREEGVPPYILFTNKQLAQIAKGRPHTLAELEKVDGVGLAKREKYGQEPYLGHGEWKAAYWEEDGQEVLENSQGGLQGISVNKKNHRNPHGFLCGEKNFLSRMRRKIFSATLWVFVGQTHVGGCGLVRFNAGY